MTRVDFYHLLQWPLERALPRLLTRAYQTEARVLVLAGSMDRVRALNSLLWTFDANAWLPHGCRDEGYAEHQPIWISDREERPNGATLAVLTEGMTVTDASAWDRVLDLFDGQDSEAVQAARDRWRTGRDAGHELHYWQQSDSGGWVEKASAKPTPTATSTPAGESG
ncbi:DNA polymerase III subunit chi [Roseospira marina]|uniref:DNA polymerase III subunit chi n=1 Tax=Roseospira marina TaxID=140057 RepID=A0A5M6II90_9PROT|nr:DNA polymerase III subunit chi [Roseospira marina]KAA5607657.1 DNA polymerase III subunit chi [Roseospira marina]MBB4312141.1 DNA polymerase-3 subunit chi [Roseospira marina]MBB5085843.1 DNA polymerase-3 subunit chi [Roseospira marina]